MEELGFSCDTLYGFLSLVLAPICSLSLSKYVGVGRCLHKLSLSSRKYELDPKLLIRKGEPLKINQWGTSG